VKSCVGYLTKTFCLALQILLLHICTYRATICQGQPRKCTQECSRFHSNRFTFGRVIMERVNTAKTRRRVNPIFGLSLSSSRIKSMYTNFLIYQQSVSRVCVSSYVKRFVYALMTFTVLHFYHRVYPYCLVAVCQPFIKLMID